MNLEVLVSTMNQEDYTLLEAMNIQTDTLFVNQCNNNKLEEFIYNGNKIRFLNMSDRGIGLSRNTALMHSTGDICLFADDDVVYVDGYEEIILNAFKENSHAHAIIFNVPSTNNQRPTAQIDRIRKLNYFNCLKYGAFCLAIKKDAIYNKNIYFSLLFGGGAKYSSGEDSLFISDCIKKGLKIYTNPSVIGIVNHAESTWFKGYTKKFFVDKGIFYRTLSSRYAYFYCLYFAIRRYKMYENDISIYTAIKYMFEGIKVREGELE